MDVWYLIVGLAIGYIAGIAAAFVIALFMGAKAERQQRGEPEFPTIIIEHKEIE